MKAVQRQVAEINHLKTAIEKTKSKYLKNDYNKAINKLTKELKEYCYYRRFDFDRVINEFSIKKEKNNGSKM